MCHIKEMIKTANDNDTVQHCIITLVKVKHLLTTYCRCCSMKTFQLTCSSNAIYFANAIMIIVSETD